MTNKTFAGISGLNPRVVAQPADELVCSDRAVGLEIEVENINRREVRNVLRGIWEVVSDGSLRPRELSGELRCPGQGYSGQQLVSALRVLPRQVCLSKATLGWRTSTHVHVDMRDKSPESIKPMLVAYALVEPFIFAWDGSGRQESRFCMPWWVCTGDILSASTILAGESDASVRHDLQRFSKYTALNLEPLSRLGTVEFRHSRGLLDPERILEYVNIALSICTLDERWPEVTSEDLITSYLSSGPAGFIDSFLPPSAAHALLRAAPGAPPLTDQVLDLSVSAALALCQEAEPIVCQVVPNGAEQLRNLL